MTEMPGLETLAIRLAELRGAVDVGNERTGGQLNLLVERSNEAKLALEAQRQWVEKELARHEREQDDERSARETADRELASEIKLLTRKSATWTGVALTLSAVGGTILGHVWPH